jgi:hypothetical protein
VQIKQDQQQFEMAVFSVLSWFKVRRHAGVLPGPSTGGLPGPSTGGCLGRCCRTRQPHLPQDCHIPRTCLTQHDRAYAAC